MAIMSPHWHHPLWARLAEGIRLDFIALISWNWSIAVSDCMKGCFKKRIWEICPSVYSSGCQSAVTDPTSSPGTILKNQILWPHSSHAALETWSAIANLCFNRSSSWFWCILKLEIHWSTVSISLKMLLLTHIYRA